MIHSQISSPERCYPSNQDISCKTERLNKTVSAPALLEAKVKAVCKDAFAEWLHIQDPDIPIEVLNELPTEEIAIWRVLVPLSSHSFFDKWLDDKISSFYSNKMEQELKVIYQKFKTQSYLKPATIETIDHLARDILKQYSKIIEVQATDDAFLMRYFAKELKIPSDSKLIRLTIEHAKRPICKIISERLGYLYSDTPRECLKKILAQDYPDQINQVSYLVNIWGKNGRKLAPIWDQ
ncbi:hypothetical protein [Candidatus Protochlamydia sp. W-9]|uniref:hypothetical protein n=1 Tax=Candidatus Protochlamydia sp. W-9 TaxID=1785087 RepID=UPI00096A5960|nr:hypothetical protein [Candidatus Protochlamydia sp. W-9]